LTGFKRTFKLVKRAFKCAGEEDRVNQRQLAKNPEKTRQSLLEAARDVFAKKGFDGARVDEIASKAGVNKALINYHFGSKRSLFQAVVEAFSKSILTRLEVAILDEDPAVTQLRKFIHTLGAITADNPELPRLILFEVSGGKRLDKGPPHILEVMGVMQGILEKGAAEGTLRVLNPQFAYFHIISSLIFFQITAPARKSLPLPADSMSQEAFLLFVEEQVVLGFTRKTTEEK